MAGNNKRNKARVIIGTRMISIITISLTLFTLGIVGLLQIAKIGLIKTTEEQVVYRLPFPENFSTSDINNAISKIRKEPYILSFSLITPDSMARLVSQKLGDNPVEVLGYNPFSSILNINIKNSYTDKDSICKVQERIRKIIPEVTLNYRKEQLNYIRSGIGKLSIVLEIIILLQLIVTFVQIGNTTKLIIHSKRMQIRTLSLVGASKSFIRRPVISRAVVDGLIGAILSLSLVSIFIFILDNNMGISVYSLLSYKLLSILYLLILVISVAISYVSSFITANRYINMDGGKINLI